MNSEILIGDVRERLTAVENGTVQTCITSPPYFGLRDYGHENQIGLESTPDEYVSELVAVFREVRRVLKDDGTLWLNLGDSYAGSGKGGQSEAKRSPGWQPEYANKGATYGLKPKDLIGIPWMVAFALRADGWFLRQDIIWAKPNPMPESVTDRCTKSHEYLFLLTKSAQYYYDHESIKEPTITRDNINRDRDSGKFNNIPGRTRMQGLRTNDYEMRNKRDVWTIPTKPYSGAHFAVMPEALVEPCVLAGSASGDLVLDPFAGSGTVGIVALRHGRNFLGVEINPEYAVMAERRIGTMEVQIDFALPSQSVEG